MFYLTLFWHGVKIGVKYMILTVFWHGVNFPLDKCKFCAFLYFSTHNGGVLTAGDGFTFVVSKSRHERRTWVPLPSHFFETSLFFHLLLPTHHQFSRIGNLPTTASDDNIKSSIIESSLIIESGHSIISAILKHREQYSENSDV